MNNFFVAQTKLDETQATLPPDITLPEHSLNLLSTSPFEVETMLKSLQLGKATGPDAINNRVLKELAKPLSFPLSDLFNFSLTASKVPLIWKEANVTPIFKKDDPSVVSNYRLISLLSTVGKVLEKIVHKHLFNFIRDNNILTTLQSGFVPGDSTVNQLVDIYNTFCHSLDQGKEVRAVFCDISKAFDRVWHRGLLYKLESAGISGSRHECVLINHQLEFSGTRVKYLDYEKRAYKHEILSYRISAKASNNRSICCVQRD